MDINTAQTSIYVTSAMQIFTDLSYSLLPLSLLTERRATHEKVGICSMILIGLLATSAAIYKTTVVKYFDFEGTPFFFLPLLPSVSVRSRVC